MPKPSASGSRNIPSEAPVAPGHSPWKHLKASDGWNKPKEAQEDHAFLMVEVMETWFLADRAMLRRFFGSGLRENEFREWSSLEGLPKRQVFKILERATAACKTPYSKAEFRSSFSKNSALPKSRKHARIALGCSRSCVHERKTALGRSAIPPLDQPSFAVAELGSAIAAKRPTLGLVNLTMR